MGQVKKAATEAMREALKVIGNKDIEHMTEKILLAITKPKEVPEIMHEMAGVTFVQSVESPALAMVVPLLLRGLREKTTATKRQSAAIINNMSKLVDEPLDAAPFLPLLLPALEVNAGSIADPEARGVTENAVEQMKRLDDLAKKAVSVRGDVSKIGPEFQKALGGDAAAGGGLEMCVAHAATIATCMMDLAFMEDVQWKKNLASTFAAYYDAAKVEEAVEQVRVAAEGMMEVVEEEEDDDAEELCNCKFTLAYGTKILLHNTKMRLLRGKKYGLLGGNDSGKTTLMRAIANNSVEGFPDSADVRTVFVEADIQGEQSHLSCIDYVFVDEKIKALGCTREEVKEMLAKVGFVPDGKAKPDHAVSTLSGGWRMKLALARAMLQKADILLMDEPTNHLDVINVAWVKSKGKALMKMNNRTFTYPVNDTPTLFDISVQVSLSSRVACVGENGAGKSTMIKLLVGEIEPQTGDVWKHPNARIAYVAQHAFHHIESHLTKTPNEYIRWRYANQGETRRVLLR